MTLLRRGIQVATFERGPFPEGMVMSLMAQGPFNNMQVFP